MRFLFDLYLAHITQLILDFGLSHILFHCISDDIYRINSALEQKLK